jgi:hypothetical protein
MSCKHEYISSLTGSKTYGSLPHFVRVPETKSPKNCCLRPALGAYLCWALKARLGFRPLIFEWHSMSGTFENARIGSVSYVAVWFRPSCDEDRCRHIDKASECRRCCGEQCPVFYPVLGELCAYLSRALGVTIRSSRRNIGRI